MTSKQDIRKMLRQRKFTGSPVEAFSIISRLKEHSHIREAHTLLLYHALNDEVPTQELLDTLVAEGKTVLLPRVVNDTEMELRRYTGIKDLCKGAFGIMEPTGQLFSEIQQIDVAVIPGMAFVRAGHRLGRGKGYYDRFLAHKGFYKIGVCYPSRLLDNIPTDEHDVQMDEVIS